MTSPTEDFEHFVAVLQRIQSLSPTALPEYRDALAILRLIRGENIDAVSADTSRPRKWLLQKAETIQAQGLAGLIPDLRERLERSEYRRRGIAQMLLGTLTERRFEAEDITAGRPLSMVKRVAERSDTDYVVNDSVGRPLFRMNIKFHGNRFPYVFLVLSIPGLSAPTIGRFVPDDFVSVLSAVKGRRVLEEAIAEELGQPAYQAQFEDVLLRMSEGEFRVVSARRADNLMRQLLFERVFALRVPRFNQSYRGAEIDMHFSLTNEMIPLRTFTELLDRESPQVVAVMLDRGEI
ncbi:MAG: hypothetical protein HYU41_16200 [Candidatus Rokubacteria bacterium]|nr:hypothetical protein [Candidatus Rokubacteria bacterium]